MTLQDLQFGDNGLLVCPISGVVRSKKNYC